MMNDYKIKIDNISCSNCARTISNKLETEFPESNVRVNVASKLLLISTTANKSAVEQALVEINYPPASQKTKKDMTKKRNELIISIIITIYFLIGMLHHINVANVPMFFVNIYVQLIFATFVQFYIARNFYIHAWNSVKAKALGMDFLIVFSTTLTYLFSVYLMIFNPDIHPYFETSTIIITIILIGKSIEGRAQAKASSLLDETNQLVDNLVQLANGNKISAQNVEVGEKVIIAANERIVIDGIIIEGSSEIDESAITGESRLVSKQMGDNVLAGTINVEHKITVQTIAYQEDSYLYKVLDSVENIVSIDTKYQRIADKVAKIFVPFIVVTGLLTFILTYYLSGDGLLAFERAMSVIVVSCPCSLGLATPTSILVSNSISTKLGILYKGGQFFELADQIDLIAFDKTGTLTLGKPKIYESTINDNLNKYVYALTSQSSHPISKVVCEAFKQYDGNIETKVTQIPGSGIETTIDGVMYQFGNKKLLVSEDDINTIAAVEKEGYTVNVLTANGQLQGYIKLLDELREDSFELIDKLKQLGIEVALITGDNQSVADLTASKLGIEQVYAGAKPDDKMKIINQLKEQYNVVTFVGDGINDGASLKAADIGISVAKSSDIAKVASDMTIIKDNLNLITDGIKLSNITRRNIKHSLMWAFSYNIVAIPLAAFGYLDMIWAAVFMGFSSIVVVLNSLHLKREYMKGKNK